MTFPTEWKVIKFMFQTTNQLFENKHSVFSQLSGNVMANDDGKIMEHDNLWRFIDNVIDNLHCHVVHLMGKPSINHIHIYIYIPKRIDFNGEHHDIPSDFKGTTWKIRRTGSAKTSVDIVSIQVLYVQ